MQYLARNKLYHTKKPYSAEFKNKEYSKYKIFNYILSIETVYIYMLKLLNNYNLNIYGFYIIKVKINLNVYNTLIYPEAVKKVYFNKIGAIFRARFPEYSRLEGIEFIVRILITLEMCSIKIILG